ncbi:class I SAM-dependent methyltransferase [Algoriphagus mannitolivorans]|uniref:class I SAM-dependent methyltransferase n=1 Tax=Algoriphagus mannitolivorans TaxID=226504 RepID=UPI0006856FFD|nr:class I SAM-dependent methyltransferase [Algoriphagus mannitolivorans]
MKCRVCSKPGISLFKAIVLKRYHVEYFKCSSCGFIQTEDPYWLSEAYESAITQLDIGLVSRNLHFSEVLRGFFDHRIFNDNGVYLDYAGGYGLFVRIMRDLGFNFYRQDTYCENLFAKHFDLEDLPQNQKFDILTAFEVFEHLPDPKSELKKMLDYSDTLVFSTLLQPHGDLTPENWWYFAPSTGQHVSFYSKPSLEYLAKEFELNFYSNGSNLHIFSRKQLSSNPFIENEKSFLEKVLLKIGRIVKSNASKVERESLTQKDFEYIKSIQ